MASPSSVFCSNSKNDEDLKTFPIKLPFLQNVALEGTKAILKDQTASFVKVSIKVSLKLLKR